MDAMQHRARRLDDGIWMSCWRPEAPNTPSESQSNAFRSSGIFWPCDVLSQDLDLPSGVTCFLSLVLAKKCGIGHPGAVIGTGSFA